MKLAPFSPETLDPQLVTQRRGRVATAVLALAAPAALVMADLHWQSGFDGWKVLHVVLFTVLFALVAFGATQACIGYWIRRKGGDPCQITRSLDPKDTGALDVPTAVIMPICNEDVQRVMEGMRTIYASVAATGKLANCDFFFLSDSTNPNHWIEEEAAWLALTQELGAHGRLFYRKRRMGTNKKAGNVADFCRRWGRHYTYMVVLDADSIMSGDAVVEFVRLMERNPQVGLIQGVPVLVNGETILARVQQFASRLYGTIFAAGLNYWQLSEGNYWGHNAIIRLAPFIRHCSLPELPGDGPFGGRIMSHDYVEAALMRRAGWQVWLATDLPGNYEECPANLIDFAKRDRRWLQGNLQHARLVVARGFHGVNRVHFTLGILSYLASPLWFLFLVLSLVIAQRAVGAAGDGEVPAAVMANQGAQALALFIATTIMLFLPKVLALLDLRGRPSELAAYGGWRKLLAGIASETLVFTLIAPVLMLFHTKFVILTLARRSVSWGAQRRGRAGESAWNEAFRAHWGHTLLGALLTVIVVGIHPGLALWMSPVLLGMILSIPLSFVTGWGRAGEALRRRGIFVTPEEAQPPPELQRLAASLAAHREGKPPLPELASDYGLLQAVLDPYVNAVHISLLRAKGETPPATEERFASLRASLLRDGPQALAPRDRLALLMDIDSMVALHGDLWAMPAARLAQWWQLALQHYNVIGPAPQTAFTR